MENQYAYAARMAELYNLLEDRLSKDIFWARLQMDCEATIEREERLFELTGIATDEDIHIKERMKAVSDKAVADGKKLFLYGTKYTGKLAGKLILQQGGDFYAYCVRNHERFADGILGKQVYPPEYVFEHPDECYVLIAATDAAEEISRILKEHGFPENHIFFYIRPSLVKNLLEKQYFEFPELFPKGKAFVDGGCCDCGTSKRFAQWCGGDYSKIFAFEPDPKNCQRCRAAADSSSLRLELIPSGLSDCAGSISFVAYGTGNSYIPGPEEVFNIYREKVRGQEITIPTTALDDIVRETEIGFIKMDIEGSELSALHGAEKTLLKDKPLLAICVYHRCGDVLVIMDYLHKLVPQYHFWLRQYYCGGSETVLYASINRP